MKTLFKFLKKMLWILLSLIALFAGGIAVFLYTAPQFGQSPRKEQVEQWSSSDQYKQDHFENLGGVKQEMTFSKMMRIMPKFLFKEDKGPSWSIPVKKLPQDYFHHSNDTLVRATWFGHSAFALEMDGKLLLLDPMFGPAASPVDFMTKRFNDTLPMSIEDLPEIDAVLFSHDHLDYPTIVKIKDKVGRFYVPLGLGSHLQKWGVPEGKIFEMDWWEEASFEGLTFVSTPAQHFSGRALTDRDKTLWSSWVIKGKNGKVFFTGDSGYFGGFKDIGDKYGPFDLCLIECGQYNEDWIEIHMMPEESVQAHIDLRGKLMMPIHWGAFDLSLHTWVEPVERALAAAEKHQVSIATPIIGESIVLGENWPDSRWWDGNHQ